MISQETTISLGNLYGFIFGRNYNSSYINRVAKNDDFGSFLFKNGFDDSWRKEALKCVTRPEIVEFFVSIHGEKARVNVENRKDICLIKLIGLILRNIDENSNYQHPYVREYYDDLINKLTSDGYFYYKQGIYTEKELQDKFQIIVDQETGKLMPQNHGTIPTVRELLLDIPLYEIIEFHKEVQEYLVRELHQFDQTIDAFCIYCNSTSTFQHSNRSPSAISYGFFEVKLECVKIKGHEIIFYFRAKNNSLIKIGQYPSIADFASSSLKKYTKILGKKYVELTKAVGLASHGVGVGSFVYLRRIFEDLIMRAYKRALENPEWKTANEIAFNQNQVRVVERILLLRDYLPNFLVKHRDIYGIISKGIHELNEQECLEYFPIIKNAIEIILDEEIERLEKEQKTLEIEKAIQKIKQDISS